jgi:hypothetical protein
MPARTRPGNSQPVTSQDKRGGNLRIGPSFRDISQNVDLAVGCGPDQRAQ